MILPTEGVRDTPWNACFMTCLCSNSSAYSLVSAVSFSVSHTQRLLPSSQSRKTFDSAALLSVTTQTSTCVG